MANNYSMNLVTGARGEDHITSADDGSLYAAFYGRGKYIMHGFGYSLVNSNLIRISEGDALINGRHCRINHGYVADLDLAAGSNGLNRIDLVVITYTKTSESSESAKLEVITGTATSGTAAQPSISSGDVLNGDSSAQFALYRISYSGVSTPVVTKLFTQASPLMDIYTELKNMIVPPVGAIEENTTGTNPSTRYPGTTWSLYGVGQFAVCYNSADSDFSNGKTGGVKSHSVKIAESNLPSHRHTTPNHSHSVSVNEKSAISIGSSGGHDHYGYNTPDNYNTTGSRNRLASSAASEISQTSKVITSSTGLHTHSVPAHTHTVNHATDGGGYTGYIGSGTAINLNNLPPYITLYRWQRTK